MLPGRQVLHYLAAGVDALAVEMPGGRFRPLYYDRERPAMPGVLRRNGGQLLAGYDYRYLGGVVPPLRVDERDRVFSYRHVLYHFAAGKEALAVEPPPGCVGTRNHRRGGSGVTPVLRRRHGRHVLEYGYLLLLRGVPAVDIRERNLVVPDGHRFRRAAALVGFFHPGYAPLGLRRAVDVDGHRSCMAPVDPSQLGGGVLHHRQLVIEGSVPPRSLREGDRVLASDDAADGHAGGVASLAVDAPAGSLGSLDRHPDRAHVPLVAWLGLRHVVLGHRDLELMRSIPSLHLREADPVGAYGDSVHRLVLPVAALSVKHPAPLVGSAEGDPYRAPVNGEHRVHLRHGVLGHRDGDVGRFVPVKNVVEGNRVVPDDEVLDHLAALVVGLSVESPAGLHRAVDVHLDGPEVPLVGHLGLRKRVAGHGHGDLLRLVPVRHTGVGDGVSADHHILHDFAAGVAPLAVQCPGGLRRLCYLDRDRPPVLCIGGLDARHGVPRDDSLRPLGSEPVGHVREHHRVLAYREAVHGLAARVLSVRALDAPPRGVRPLDGHAERADVPLVLAIYLRHRVARYGRLRRGRAVPVADGGERYRVDPGGYSVHGLAARVQTPPVYRPAGVLGPHYGSPDGARVTLVLAGGRSHRALFHLDRDVGGAVPLRHPGEGDAALAGGNVLDGLAAPVRSYPAKAPAGLVRPLHGDRQRSGLSLIDPPHGLWGVLGNGDGLRRRRVPSGDLLEGHLALPRDLCHRTAVLVGILSVQRPSSRRRSLDRDPDGGVLLNVLGIMGRLRVALHGDPRILRPGPQIHVREGHEVLSGGQAGQGATALVAALAVQAPARRGRTLQHDPERAPRILDRRPDVQSAARGHLAGKRLTPVGELDQAGLQLRCGHAGRRRGQQGRRAGHEGGRRRRAADHLVPAV